MAIAFDAKTAATTNVLTSLTYSHTCTGSDRILFVTATGNQGPTATMSATYNGVSMTAIGPSIDSIGTGVPTYVWYLVNPASGANNVVVTSSVIGISTSAISYTGVAQTSPIDVSNTTAYNTTSTSYSKSVTTTTNNCWLLATVRCASGQAMTAGANTTLRNQTEAVLFGGGLILDSGAAVATGSNTLTSTCTSQFLGGQIIIGFKPVVTDTFIPRVTYFM